MRRSFRVVLIALLMVVGLGETATAFAQPPRYRHHRRHWHPHRHYRHHR